MGPFRGYQGIEGPIELLGPMGKSQKDNASILPGTGLYKFFNIKTKIPAIYNYLAIRK